MKSVPGRSNSLCCLQREITAPQSFMTAANIWLTECDGNHCLRWFTNPSATAGNSQYHRAYYLINTAFICITSLKKDTNRNSKALGKLQETWPSQTMHTAVSKCGTFWPSYLPVFLHKDRYISAWYSWKNTGGFKKYLGGSVLLVDPIITQHITEKRITTLCYSPSVYVWALPTACWKGQAGNL